MRNPQKRKAVINLEKSSSETRVSVPRAVIAAAIVVVVQASQN